MGWLCNQKLRKGGVSGKRKIQRKIGIMSPMIFYPFSSRIFA